MRRLRQGSKPAVTFARVEDRECVQSSSFGAGRRGRRNAMRIRFGLNSAHESFFRWTSNSWYSRICSGPSRSGGALKCFAKSATQSCCLPGPAALWPHCYSRFHPTNLSLPIIVNLMQGRIRNRLVETSYPRLRCCGNKLQDCHRHGKNASPQM